MGNNKMHKLHDTPSDALIKSLAEYFETNHLLNLPKHADIMKTSSGKENSPLERNWYYVRTASILRKISLNSTTYNMSYDVDARKPKMHKAFSAKNDLTVTRLCSMYGCRKNRGCRPGKKVRGYRSLT